MLFGAGIVIMASRCESMGRRAAGLHYRRMTWLLLIGLLHAHLIWYGDILYTYAVCGMLLFVFRKLPSWALVLIGVLLLSVSFLISLGFGWLLASGEVPGMREQMMEPWSPTAEQIQAELDTYRGSWLQQQPRRMATSFFFETFLFLMSFGWRSSGLILIGMALYKLDVFSAKRPRSFYVTLVVVAICIGLPTVAWGIYRNEAAGWAVEYSFFWGPLFNYWGSILVALGWVGGVMLVCQSEGVRPWTRPFAAAGRMALSNYLMQSIFATLIFYGHGFGQFGRLQRWQQLLTVVLIWVFQLVFSVLWLRVFRYGPFEWLWRSLTYWQIQPIIRDQPKPQAVQPADTA
jgi:uncharacterized protein